IDQFADFAPAGVGAAGVAASAVGLGGTRLCMGSGNQDVSNTCLAISRSIWGRIWVFHAWSKVWNSYSQFSARFFGNTPCSAVGITPFCVIMVVIFSVTPAKVIGSAP